MPRLKWLMFHMPMSSPQRIRIFGCFAIVIPSFISSVQRCGCRPWPEKVDLDEGRILYHSGLGSGRLWNSQCPCSAEYKGGSYKVGVGGVLMLTLEVEVQILRREDVCNLSTDGVHRVVGKCARWDGQVSR